MLIDKPCTVYIFNQKGKEIQKHENVKKISFTRDMYGIEGNIETEDKRINFSFSARWSIRITS